MKYLVLVDDSAQTGTAATLRSTQLAAHVDCGPVTQSYFPITTTNGKSALLIPDDKAGLLTADEQAALLDTLNWNAPYIPTAYTGPTETGGLPEQPFDLQAAIANLQPGGLLELPDGIYVVDGILALGPAGISPEQRTIIRAASGARPLVIDSTGGAPYVQHSNNMLIDGLWFGGIRLGTVHPVTLADYVTIQNCVYFGYKQCIAEGGGQFTKYLNNLFVHNGKYPGDHDIYVSNYRSESREESAHIEGNIFIGGEGYGIHFYHSPLYGQVIGNFISKRHAIVTQGGGSRFIDNVIWSGHHNIESNLVHYSLPQYPLSIPREFSGNLYGANTAWIGSFPGNDTVTNNRYVNRPDVGGVAIAARDIATITGHSAGQIDGAISALERAFSQSVVSIQADTTIAAHVQILKSTVSHNRAATVAEFGR